MRRACVASLISLLALLACNRGQGDGAPAVSAEAKALSVASTTVELEEVVDSVFGTGTIAAQKTTHIGPRVDGIIEEIFVQTRRDRDRMASLYGSQVASTDQLDEARTAHQMAAARLGSAQTALERASQDLDDTIVTAPYAGVITHRYVDEGTMMRTMMSGSSPVLELMKTDVVLAVVQIPELDLPRVRVEMPARVEIDGMAKSYESYAYIVNDRVDPQSRAVEVRLPIENPDLAIKPGLFAQAELFPEPREALVLDRRTVLGSEGAHHVFVAKNGRAKPQPVQARELDATRMEILSGLAAGDHVLAGPNLSRLSAGTPIVETVAHVDR
jgi:RND family efflux transporter MFP subunit